MIVDPVLRSGSDSDSSNLPAQRDADGRAIVEAGGSLALQISPCDENFRRPRSGVPDLC